MAKYKIWDKTSDIYTLGIDSRTGKNHYTADEYMSIFAPWAKMDSVKIVVGGGVVNGTVFMEFDSMKEFYENQGCDFSACTTDEEVLKAIEEWEKNPPVDDTPTTDERIAAALEYQIMASLPDEEEV